jgi:hypothetical protein
MILIWSTSVSTAVIDAGASLICPRRFETCVAAAIMPVIDEVTWSGSSADSTDPSELAMAPDL